MPSVSIPGLVDHKLTFEDAKASPAPVSYAMSGSGVVVVYKTLLGTFWTVRGTKIAGLPELSSGFELRVPKPPFSLLLDALALLKRVHAMYGTEAFVLICYDHAVRRYFLECPPQRVSSASVNYEKTAEFTARELAGEVSVFMEIHSHPGSMDTFSGTDDRDEQGVRFYAVASSMRCTLPAVTVTFGVAGNRCPVDSLADVFDLVLPDYTSLINERVQSRPVFQPGAGFRLVPGVDGTASALSDRTYESSRFWGDNDDDDLVSWQYANGLLDELPMPQKTTGRRRGRPRKNTV